ncbi:MAG: ParB/RepB/Spo0J family partition protein [Phycisphaerae bacterium]
MLSIGTEYPPPAQPNADEKSKHSEPAPIAAIPVDQLRPNPFQPRRDIPPAQLRSLAESIRQSGIIQPLAVRPISERVYEIIAGERRWRAAQLAGLSSVPVTIRAADDQQMLEMALIENIYREDLNAIDRAMAYRRYCDEFQRTADEVAQRLGEDRATVSNYLRLLDLPTEVKQWVAEGKLAMGHARCLLGLKSAAEIIALGKQAIEQGLSVRAIEKLVRDRLAARAEAAREKPGAAKRAEIRDLEQVFTRTLGAKVEIHESARKGRGRLVIHYQSLDDFDRIMERVGVASP